MWDRPDDLFIGLEFNLSSKSLVRMCIGHYSEILPNIDLQDRKQREQKYWNYGNVLIVAFQNCIKSYKDFRELINLLEKEQLIIDLQSVFSNVYNVCQPYTILNPNPHFNPVGMRKYPVHNDIFRKAKKVTCYLHERGKEFGIKINPALNQYVPIELGAFLQSVQYS
jgi:hypothetical protein